MSLRPKPVRVALLVIAFYVLVYGLALRPEEAPIRPRAWKRVSGPVRMPVEALPPPIEPPPREAPVPGRFQDLADHLLRPEPREWKYVILHHSATLEGNAAQIDKFHREVNGWDGLGYHFVFGNGRGAPLAGLEVGFRWVEQKHGAHAGTNEHNQRGIGICVVGNYQVSEFPEEIYSAVLDLTVWLCRRFAIPPEAILPHNAVRPDPTDCPGRNFPMERLRRDATAALK